MDESWQKVREIFDSALLRQPEERLRFITEACGEDKPLYTEVESLLSSLDCADNFLETPAVAGVADAFVNSGNKLEKGQSLGHYKIVKEIGSGGMGEVYLAKDQKLDRQVAVKILNEKFSNEESNLNRFVREAKATSALNHPNILVIHEIGEADGSHYIISEFIKGQTLRYICKERALQLSEVLDISVQIAGALAAAHEAHLIHRDIKPENIMVRPDGYVKILDFGLAKLVEEKNRSFLGLEEPTAFQNPTAKGMILGTVNYMSPEQAKGEDVDERTDIFSFGVLMYEMIAGRTPFGGDSMSETFANLIKAEPQPLTRFVANVPDEIQRIISKTLNKHKDSRYLTIKDLLADLKDLRDNLTIDERLERSASPGAHATEVLRATTGDANKSTAETQYSFSRQIKRHKPFAAITLIALLTGAIGLGYYFFVAGKIASVADGKISIAVLPLKPINTANRDEVYEVGIAESLIIKLGSMKGFVVRHLSATRQYTDINQDPLVAGREQKVDYVLASNYQRADGKIKITAQLFNVANGQIEETYQSEKDIASIFAIQDAIASEVGDILLERFGTTPTRPAVKRGTTNEEAYRLYLQGTALVDKRTQEAVRLAVEYFERAVRLDPSYALAYTRLANAHTAVVLNRSGNMQEQYPKAKAAIEKALAIDDDLAEAHSYLGEIKSDFEGDFAGAEREHKRAIELNPNSSVAHRMYALLLTYLGRHDDSIAESKTAIDLEPVSVLNHLVFGRSMLFARRYDEAIAELERAAEIDPEYFFAHQSLSLAYRFKGDDDRAFESFVKKDILAGEEPDEINLRKTIYAKSGWQGILARQLEQAKEKEKSGKPNYDLLANLSSELGQREEAFAYLEKALVQHGTLTMLKVHPRFDFLRDDPRFDELLKRVGLK